MTNPKTTHRRIRLLHVLGCLPENFKIEGTNWGEYAHFRLGKYKFRVNIPSKILETKDYYELKVVYELDLMEGSDGNRSISIRSYLAKDQIYFLPLDERNICSIAEYVSNIIDCGYDDVLHYLEKIELLEPVGV